MNKLIDFNCKFFSKMKTLAKGFSTLAMEAEFQSVKTNLKNVREKLALVRKENNLYDARLVAVSKLKSVEHIRAAYEEGKERRGEEKSFWSDFSDLGQRVFGENYVQELVEKFPQLPEDIEWHMIGEEGHNYDFSGFFFFFPAPGHVTSSNVRKLLQVKNLACLETIDSVKSATKINKVLVEQNRNLNVFVQVNTSGEESKFGAEPEEAIELIRSVKNCSNLSFKGLMTIGDLFIFFYIPSSFLLLR
jgi:uncharacterized pyridoxal phosphate-containing UPF0001 family protein